MIDEINHAIGWFREKGSQALTLISCLNHINFTSKSVVNQEQCSTSSPLTHTMSYHTIYRSSDSALHYSVADGKSGNHLIYSVTVACGYVWLMVKWWYSTRSCRPLMSRVPQHHFISKYKLMVSHEFLLSPPVLFNKQSVLAISSHGCSDKRPLSNNF